MNRSGDISFDFSLPDLPFLFLYFCLVLVFFQEHHVGTRVAAGLEVWVLAC